MLTAKRAFQVQLIARGSLLMLVSRMLQYYVLQSILSTRSMRRRASRLLHFLPQSHVHQDHECEAVEQGHEFGKCPFEVHLFAEVM